MGMLPSFDSLREPRTAITVTVVAGAAVVSGVLVYKRWQKQTTLLPSAQGLPEPTTRPRRPSLKFPEDDPGDKIIRLRSGSVVRTGSLGNQLGCGDCKDVNGCTAHSAKPDLPSRLAPTTSMEGSSVVFPKCVACNDGDLEDVAAQTNHETLCATSDQIPEVFGRIHSMESFSAVDGHGIRTVIFLQGCQRRCVFCSNPDTWKKGKNDGKEMSSKTIAKQLKRFLPYMKSSGGGVTCSGGEPMMQAKFVAAIFQEAHALGVNTVIDTAGWGNQEDYDTVLPHTDRVMLCVKAMDPVRYKKICGGTPQKNLLQFFDAICARKVGLWIRLVLIAGETDNEEELKATVEFGMKHPDFHGIEVLPYHRLGIYKWEQLGIKYPMGDTPAMSEDRVRWALDYLEKITTNTQVKVIR